MAKVRVVKDKQVYWMHQTFRDYNGEFDLPDHIAEREVSAGNAEYASKAKKPGKKKSKKTKK